MIWPLKCNTQHRNCHTHIAKRRTLTHTHMQIEVKLIARFTVAVMSTWHVHTLRVRTTGTEPISTLIYIWITDSKSKRAIQHFN